MSEPVWLTLQPGGRGIEKVGPLCRLQPAGSAVGSVDGVAEGVGLGGAALVGAGAAGTDVG
ncbi:hypothetical protein ABT214_16215, partial [Micromonospora purpureochromogenes]|uniref:hypothetical protein n=1 Tax=Micromonospora purpureochromogenes TaxID=47872 RepID=UPI00331D4111